MSDIAKIASQSPFASEAVPVRPHAGKTRAPRQAPSAASVEAMATAVAERVAALNDALAQMNVRLRFQLGEGPEAVRILVVDGETGEIIRKIPPDYFLNTALGAAGAGLMLDEGL